MKGLVFGMFGMFFLFSLSGEAKAAEFVTQKDWPEYFSNIERHPSVYEPEFEAVDMTYETPHTKWAKPYYLGKTKVMVIAPRVCHRDTIELAQRLDMEFDAFCAYSSMRLGGAESLGRYSTPVGLEQEKQVARLNKLLNKNYDVIIIGQMFWNAFPKEIADKILKKVKEGTGLLISFAQKDEQNFIPSPLKDVPSIGATQKELTTEGIPFTALSSWNDFKSNKEAEAKIISLKEFGKGRVVILNVGGNSRNTFFVPPPPNKPEIKLWQLDYYLSLAAKTVLWVAGKEPTDSINCVIKDNIVEIQTSGIGKPVSFNFKIRDEWGGIVYEKADRENTFKLPELASGEYIMDVILKKNGKCLDWFSTSFKVEKEPIVQSIEISPKTIKPGDKLTLTTILSGKAKEDTYLRIKLIDAFDRLIGDINQKILPDQNTAKTEFTLNDPLTNLIKVSVFLDSKSQKLSHFEKYVPVKLPYPKDDFGFASWYLISNEYSWYYARKELAKLGIDSSYGGQGTNWMQAWTAATVGFHIIPYMTRYAISEVSEGLRHERIPCLSDPDYIKTQQEELKKIAEETSLFAPMSYSLGDENDLSLNDVEVCFSKSCREGFRGYVKNIYKNLNALNEEWGTSYNSWQEIEPITLAEARKLSQPARWVNFRMHMENVFLNIHKTGVATVKEIDSDALVGFDGGFDITSFTGYDWWKLSRVLGLWGIYPDQLQSEILRSFHKQEAITGRWYGGYNHLTRFVEYARWEPWYDLFHEMNSSWWFNVIASSTGDGQAEDAMNPTSFKPFPILKASSEEVIEIKRGMGKLLLGCRRDSGGIAILYSQPSLHAATFYSKYGNPNDSQYDFIRILEDLNHQYRFISYEQLKEGILIKENYRLLMLPCSIALSGEEKEQIYSFVDSGGKIIADVRPGIYDGYGKPAGDLKWEKFLEGKVAVIGETLKGYKRNNVNASDKRAFFFKKLRDLGIKPEFSVTSSAGDIYEGELASFTEGNIRYVGLLRDHSPKMRDQKAEIKLPQKNHIYNIRTRKYLGYTDTITAYLKPGAAGLWAVMPEKISTLELQMEPEVNLGDEICYSISLKTPYRHIIRVEVFDCEGILQRHYCQNLTLSNGSAKGIIPLALNDKKGYWMMRAWDVATGVSNSKRFRIR